MKGKFIAAMAAYAVLAALAVFMLEGRVRIAVLGLFAGLALKTWIARASGQDRP
jgi:hypothetical protein